MVNTKHTNKDDTSHSIASVDKLVIDSSYEFISNQPVLSLVIPVYNVEKFLDRCLQSVICQTYTNIEIICVNDASTGNEDAIIRKYCELDKRIKYVQHKSNQGLFQARITGMKYATGDYFAFLDSDDHVSIDFYRILMNKITHENADIVIADFVDEYEDGRIEYYNFDNTRFKDISLNGEAVYDSFMKQHGLWFGWHTVWNKVYKKDIWNSSLNYLKNFSDEHGHLVMTEDIAFSCTFWRFADRVVNSHNVVYYYYHHSGQSVSNNNLEKFKKNANDVKAVFDYFKNILVAEGVYEKYENDYTEFLNIYIEFWTGNANALVDNQRKEGVKHIEKLFGTTKPENYKDHYHYTMRTSVASFEWYEQIKRNICSKNTHIVSFDIFDTLVTRPFLKPSDLFCLMNDKFNELIGGVSYVDFEKIRINVEASLRKKLSMGAEEVSIDSIYEEIGRITGLDREKINELKNYEAELEIKFIQPRKCGKELYELAKHMKKRVIFVSDIYLPESVITKILNKCGYAPDKLYLSSEYLMSKCTGHLFDTVLQNEKCRANEMVHIGDNWDSDIVQPQKRKIIVHHLAAPISQLKGENQGIYTGLSYRKIFGTNGKQYMGENAADFLGIRCMLAIVANKIFDNPYITPFNTNTDFNSNPYFIGYYALGMHLYAVTNWISSIAEKENRDTIHFVSRDGYLPMKAYDILRKYRTLNSNPNYLYISRKATALLQGEKLTDIQSYINSYSSYNINIKTPIDTFAMLADDSLKSDIANLAKHGIPYMGKLRGFDEAMNFGKIMFNEYILSEKSSEFNSYAKAFFSDTIKENDILFDLGYRGNKEYILSSLIGRPVDCLYIYSNESKALQRSYNRFSLRTFYDYTPSAFAAAREYMFSEFAPSCIGYDIENGFAPIFDENFSEHYFNSFVVNTMQEAALDFVEDFEKTFSNTVVTHLYRNFDASLPFEFFMNYATRTDRDVMGCVTFEDDTFAGAPSKMIDDWEKALNYHKLNGQDIEKYTIQTQVRVVDRDSSEDVNSFNSAMLATQLPMENIYSDGLFVKAFKWLNEKYPIGSKKRERLKKIVGKFIK